MYLVALYDDYVELNMVTQINAIWPFQFCWRILHHFVAFLHPPPFVILDVLVILTMPINNLSKWQGISLSIQ